MLSPNRYIKNPTAYPMVLFLQNGGEAGMMRSMSDGLHDDSQSSFPPFSIRKGETEVRRDEAVAKKLTRIVLTTHAPASRHTYAFRQIIAFAKAYPEIPILHYRADEDHHGYAQSMLSGPDPALPWLLAWALTGERSVLPHDKVAIFDPSGFP